MKLKFSACALAVALVAVAANLLPAGPALASGNKLWSQPMHQGFVKKGTIRFYTPNICVRYNLSGVLNYTARIKHWYDSDIDTWLYTQSLTNVSISTVSLTIDGYKPNGSKCTSTRKKWSEATLKIGSRGYSCSFNPSISVSVPWGISVSAWPSCGSKKLGLYKTTLTHAEYHHKMLRSADVIRFDKNYAFSQQMPNSEKLRTNIDWRCYGLSARVGVTQTGVGDDERPTSRAAACPGWDGSWGIFAGDTPVTVP